MEGLNRGKSLKRRSEGMEVKESLNASMLGLSPKRLEIQVKGYTPTDEECDI